MRVSQNVNFNNNKVVSLARGTAVGEGATFDQSAMAPNGGTLTLTGSLVTSSSIGANSLALTGTSSITADLDIRGGVTPAAGTAYGLLFNSGGTTFTLSPATNNNAIVANIDAIFGTGTQTITNAYGIYIPAFTKNASTTVTTAYGLYINTQTIGATNRAAYFGGKVVIADGTQGLNYVAQSDANGVVSWTASTATTGGWLSDTYGYHAPGTTGQIGIGANTLNNVQVNIQGTVALIAASSSFGIYVIPTLTPASATSAFGIDIAPTIVAGTGLTITAAYGIYVPALVKSGTGTITTAYGYYQAVPTIGGTNNYGIYIDGSVGNGTGTVSQVIKLGSSQTGDMFQTQTNAGAINYNINQYGNIGIGAQSTYQQVQMVLGGSVTGRVVANNVHTFLIQNTMLVNPGSGAYPVYISPTVDVASGTTSTYTGVLIGAATKTGAGSFSTTSALVINASTFGTVSNYAATFTGGNVGIGTATPGTLLTVNGAIQSTTLANSSNASIGGALNGVAGLIVGSSNLTYNIYMSGGTTVSTINTGIYGFSASYAATVAASTTGCAVYSIISGPLVTLNAGASAVAYSLYITAPTGATSNITAYLAAGVGIANSAPNAAYSLDITGATHTTGNMIVGGTLSKGAGTFHIDHPLDAKNSDLIHGFVEAPRYDLIYRSQRQKIKLVGGKAEVDIDKASGMRRGTFAALVREEEAEIFLQNKTGFVNAIASEIHDGFFTIRTEKDDCYDTFSWFVVAERKDPFVMHSETLFTDEEGRLIPERTKDEPEHEHMIGTETIYTEEIRSAAKDHTHIITQLIGKKGYPLHPEAIGLKHPKRTVLHKRRKGK